MPFLHIYIWLKALNDYGMKNIMADLREILHFETMSKTLVKDVSYVKELFYVSSISDTISKVQIHE